VGGWGDARGRFVTRPLESCMKKIKAEVMLAELNRLRKDLDEDPSDIEWLALHHAFCFISYKMFEFQAYLDGEAAKGAFDDLEA
jgi:hypothetical protein